MTTCKPLNGNPDFYGLGIRIGIYLQWISAWIKLLLDPESAQDTYGPNTIFVFAILIATIIAHCDDTAPIELYIMLQFMLGFFITTLSILGVRFWLMTPGRLAKFEEVVLAPLWQQQRNLLDRTRQQWKQNIWNKGLKNFAKRAASLIVALVLGFLNISYQIWNLPKKIPLPLLSPLKPPGFSWSGVTWRSITASMVAAYGLVFWFDGSGRSAQQPDRPGCGPPVVFLFSKQELEGPAVSFHHVVAISFAIFVFPATFLLVLLIARLFLYGCLLICREILYKVNPDEPNTVQAFLGEIYERQQTPQTEHINKLDRFISLIVESPIVPQHLFQRPLSFFGQSRTVTGLTRTRESTFMDVLKFLSVPKSNAIQFSDVIKVFVSLGTGNVTAEEGETGQSSLFHEPMPSWKGGKLKHQVFCFFFNICIILGIVWFIVSIELTIRWNNIQGVNTIKSTSQLIPFIIGLASTSQVVKKLTLLALIKIYPDWEQVTLEVESGLESPAFFRIVKRDERDGQGDVSEGVDNNNEGIELTAHQPHSQQISQVQMCRD